MSSEEGVWATVTATTLNWRVKRYLVRFERGLWFIVDPGKNVWDMKPRNVERTDPFTLNVETGFWNYGKVTLKFDSSRDADGVEEKIRGMLSK